VYIVIHAGINEKIDSGNFAFEIFALRSTACIDGHEIKQNTDF